MPVTGGQLVREARRRRLAARAGVSQPTIARIEFGHVRSTFERITELVRASGFDLDNRVVPLDEDAFALAEQNLARTPDQRLDALLHALELYEGSRQSGG